MAFFVARLTSGLGETRTAGGSGAAFRSCVMLAYRKAAIDVCDYGGHAMKASEYIRGGGLMGLLHG